jgi:ABC-type phosphate/phosphonate transport system ATPase subunit
MGAEIGNGTNASVASQGSLLSVRGLTRRFGGLTAVDDIDLDLARGELVSIIGPNGAGKTYLVQSRYRARQARRWRGPSRWATYHRLFAREDWRAAVSHVRSSSVACSATSA